MLLAILIITVTFRTVPKFQSRIIILCPAADGAFALFRLLEINKGLAADYAVFLVVELLTTAAILLVLFHGFYLQTMAFF